MSPKKSSLLVAFTSLLIVIVLFMWFNDLAFFSKATTNDSSQTTPETSVSLQEKVGQLFVIGHWSDTLTSQTTALVAEHHLGGVILMDAVGDPRGIKAQTTEWQNASMQTPLFIAIDQEGGIVSRIKHPSFTQTAQPEITDSDTAYQIASMRAEELSALGINTNFAPVLDSSTNPDAFMYDRTFQPPESIALLADAMMRGYQNNGVLAVPKHYPGHPDTLDDSHFTLPIVNLTSEEYKQHTRAFTDVVQAGNTHILMTAHVLVPSLDSVYPTSLSPNVIRDLRERIGFQGVILTDDLAMQAISDRWTYEESAVVALMAGADMIMLAAEPESASSTIAAVVAAVKDGTLSESRIDEAYERVLAVKREL
jgi:beta-N-acetylhexosaminidase